MSTGSMSRLVYELMDSSSLIASKRPVTAAFLTVSLSFPGHHERRGVP